MMSSTLLPGSAAPSISSYPIKPSSSSPLSVFSWRLQSEQQAYVGLPRSNRHALQVFVNANRTPNDGIQALVFGAVGAAAFLIQLALTVPRGKGKRADVIMVDPLEAKRLAAEQMQKIKAKEKLKRQRQIEAINGAWAMIGLTAGLAVECQTGNGILAQVAGYLASIKSFFAR